MKTNNRRLLVARETLRTLSTEELDSTPGATLVFSGRATCNGCNLNTTVRGSDASAIYVLCHPSVGGLSVSGGLTGG